MSLKIRLILYLFLPSISGILDVTDITKLVQEVKPKELTVVSDFYVDLTTLASDLTLKLIESPSDKELATLFTEEMYSILIILQLDTSARVEICMSALNRHNYIFNTWVVASDNFTEKAAFQFIFDQQNQVEGQKRVRLSPQSQLYFLKDCNGNCSKEIIEIQGNANDPPTFTVKTLFLNESGFQSRISCGLGLWWFVQWMRSGKGQERALNKAGFQRSDHQSRLWELGSVLHYQPGGWFYQRNHSCCPERHGSLLERDHWLCSIQYEKCLGIPKRGRKLDRSYWRHSCRTHWIFSCRIQSNLGQKYRRWFHSSGRVLFRR